MQALADVYVLRAVVGVAEFKLIPHAADRQGAQVVHDERWRAASAAAVASGLQQPIGDDVRTNYAWWTKFQPKPLASPATVLIAFHRRFNVRHPR